MLVKLLPDHTKFNPRKIVFSSNGFPVDLEPPKSSHPHRSLSPDSDQFSGEV